MFKKIALIVLFLGVTFGVGYMLYRFFFGAPVVTPPPTGNEVGVPGTGAGLPTANEGRPPATGGAGAGGPGTGITPAANVSSVAAGGPTAIQTISEQQTMGVHATTGGNVAYYDTREGKFYQVMPDGKTQVLSDRAFPEAEAVDWAPTGNKVLVTFPDASKVIYDFATQKQVTLPKHWQDVTFTPDGSSVVAKSIGLDPGSRWLVSAKSDGSSEKLIEPLGENGDKVTISVSPDESIVAFSDTSDPVGFSTRDLLVIGQNHENFQALRVEGFDFVPEWSPNGNHLLYSAAGQAGDFAPMLWLVNGSNGTLGAGRQNLGIRTWADKCVFQGEDTVYCAVPQSLPRGAGLQRDIADTIPDSVLKVDLQSGTASLVGSPENPTSMRTLTLSSDGSKLYFTTPNGALKEMRLR